MKLIALSSLFLALSFTQSFAQVRCGFEQNTENLSRIDPGYRSGIEEMNTTLKKYIAEHITLPGANSRGAAATVIIPCVVHVIHTGNPVGGTYNPNDATIISAINYLNSVYDGTWNGSGGSILGVGDLQIKFVLATKDPSNAATTGIERIDGSGLANYTTNGVNSSGSSGASEVSVKNLARWDPYRYYNIWLVNKIDGCDGISGCSSFVAGYAYFPVSSNSSSLARDLDGTIMLASQMVAGQKTLPHEVGHAFNLYHPFEGEVSVTGVNTCPSTDPTQGDQCADTDPVTNPFDDGEAVSFACRTGANHCGGTYSDNTEKNFMNYTNCYRLFTANQKTRMQAAAVSTMRASLATSWANNQGSYPFTWAAPVAAAITPVSTNSAGNVAGITSVTLNGRSIYSLNETQDGGYQNKAASWYDLFDLQTNTTYTMTVKTLGSNREQLGVYLDYNGDGSFNNTNEKLFYQNDIPPASSLVSFTFTTPSTAPSGAIRLRVTEDLSTAHGAPVLSNTSSSLMYGQAEDYPVFIKLATPLPVDLTEFTGHKIDDAISLNWTSASEANLQAYAVERSLNGQDFSTLGTVQPKGPSAYVYDDRTVYGGTYYYRLKMTDRDGSVRYSRVISFSYLGTGRMVVQTNPFTDHIDVVLADGINPYECRLMDASGRTVYASSGLPSNGTVRISLQGKNLSKGVYILQLVQDGKVSTSKLLK